MAIDSAIKASVKPDRLTRWLLIAIGVYSALFVGFLNLVILNSGKVKDRAIFLMAGGGTTRWPSFCQSLQPSLLFPW